LLPERNAVKYLHTMVRVTDIEQSLRFYRDALGLRELSRRDYPQGRYTLVFLAAPGDESAQIELTHNWDPEGYTGGRNFGHLAYAVDDIYAACRRLMDHGVTVNRPSRGFRAFAGQYLDRAAAEGCGAVSGGALDHHAQRRRVVAAPVTRPRRGRFRIRTSPTRPAA